MMRRIVFICLLLPVSLSAAATDPATLEAQDISAERMKRVDDLAERYVEEGRVAGIVTLVTRHGVLVQSSARGTLGLDNDQPVQMDTLFRIYSMTKAITAVAALVLYEEGHFHLDDPVEKFLPLFRNIRVRKNGELRPPKTKMTMHQLFTHMSGLGYQYDYAQEPGWVDPATSPDLDTFIEQLVQLPLQNDPGEVWRYSYASDVLGAVVQRISGMPLAEFLETRLFKPLGMHDTAFALPPEKRHRLASNHFWNMDNGAMQLLPDEEKSGPYRVAPYDAGGHGLISTAGDYLRFLEMLRRGGELDGQRILGAKTVRFMTRNHLPKSITDANIGPEHDPMLGLGGGHGLGIGVYIDPVRRGVLSSAGEVDWGGVAGTIYWWDPVEDVIVLAMTQLMNSPWRLRDDMAVGVYQALTASNEK